MSPKTICIAAALVLRDNGDTVLVRKRATTSFMQPGGKIETGETPVHALLRELVEEIRLVAEAGALLPMGQVLAPAAYEPGHIASPMSFASISATAPSKNPPRSRRSGGFRPSTPARSTWRL